MKPLNELQSRSRWRLVKRLLAVTLIPVLGIISVPALSAETPRVLEEVFVTATRRGITDQQSTPVAVSIINEEDFDKLFAADIGEIAASVPNFSAATVTGFNAASFAMRGGGETDIIVYFDPKVGVILDDFVIPHVQTQLLEPFDIEAIEVLRGPQGTLFGKNTTAGAIVVHTKKPDLEEVYVDFGVRAGDWGTQEVRFAVNIPLSDTLGFRFAGINQESDGYYKNGKVTAPLVNAFGAASGDALAAIGQVFRGDRSDVGGKDVFSGRMKLLWEPTDDFSALFQYEYIKDRSDAVPVINETPVGGGQLAELFGFVGIGGGDPLDQAGIHKGTIVGLRKGQRVDVDGFYVNLDWTLADYTVSVVAGMRDQESRLPSEYLGTPYESFFAATRDDDRETRQLEARIASNYGGAANFVAGVFYQTNDVEFCVLQVLGLVEFFGSAVPEVLDNQNPLLLCNKQDADSVAAFVDVTYDISDRMQLGAGVRYTKEEKDFVGRVGLPLPVIDPSLNVNTLGDPLKTGQNFNLGAAFVNRDSETWNEATWRLTLSYQISDDVFTYGTLSHGFKSGGYNDQAGSAGAFPLEPYDPELADSFEIGLKTDLLENTLRLNLTLFLVDYEDFQRSTVVSLAGTAFQETITFNAAEVTAKGIEVELSYLVSDGLTLSANLGWLDAEYDKFLLDRDFDGVEELDLSGRDVTRAPEYTAGVDVTYVQDFAAGSSLRYNLSFMYEEENTYYYNDDLGEQFDTILDQRNILNASITWKSSDDNYTVSLFGKNLTDDRYRTASQAVGVLWTFSNYGPPRFYGIDVTARVGR